MDKKTVRIKEAAAMSALTERAVRFYEECGLISPVTVNKNGRDFREYSADDVERLKVISSLRRALFTVDEIKTMLESPESIKDILEENRRRVREDFEQLSFLVGRLDAVAVNSDGTDIINARALSKAIFAPDKEVADESGKELYSEQYRKIYDKYFSENTGWEFRYGLAVRISEFFSHRTVKACVICAAVMLLLGVLLINAGHREDVDTAYRGYWYVAGDADVRFGAEVRVEGELTRYLLRDNKFSGTLYFQGCEVDDHRNKYGSGYGWIYRSTLTPHGDVIHLGGSPVISESGDRYMIDIYSTPDFDEFMIEVVPVDKDDPSHAHFSVDREDMIIAFVSATGTVRQAEEMYDRVHYTAWWEE